MVRALRTDVQNGITIILKKAESPLHLQEVVEGVQTVLREMGSDTSRNNITRHMDRLKSQGKLMYIDNDFKEHSRRTSKTRIIMADRQTQFYIQYVDKVISMFMRGHPELAKQLLKKKKWV